MTDAQQREAARQFYYRWNGKGREDEDARSYWIEILTNILGVERVTERVDFEKKVVGSDGNTKRIDVYIPETHTLIEQKSLGIALDKPQAGHDGMTPYEQAKMYDNGLVRSEKARWIVTSNFAEIWIYDMEQRRPEPVKLALADLQSKYHMLDFLTNKETKKVTDEMKLSLDAGRLVGQIYDAFLKQYRNPEDPETLKSLNKLCVRIVFCLYGEDAGIFGKRGMFHDYMAQFDAAHARKGLRDLFRVLDQKQEDRDPYLADDDPLLAAFPYVNGGLFSDEDIEIPPFTDEIMNLILRNASDNFDWSEISPTIFGAVFESTLNPETRRSGGMHYTSIENIHKVIDPLFLDDLKAEFEEIKKITVVKTQEKKLRALQDKLASLSWLDPAAGSGNFLTESYLSIRKLENEILYILTHGQISLGIGDLTPIKVNISQFYGIEINDFAVTVARTALWIAENQMMKATEDIVHMSLDFLPLKTNAHIVEGNALRIDWNDVVPKEKLNYIMGNPPFVGHKNVNPKQKHDMKFVFDNKQGRLDYVSAWYLLAAKYIRGTQIQCAFVSTNTIVQGVHIETLWTRLTGEFNIHINFAYTTFKWMSEAKEKASVFCVIIGFSQTERMKKVLFESNLKTDEYSAIDTDYISPYLTVEKDSIVSSRSTPVSNVSKMIYGNIPRDGGYYTFTDEEREIFLSREPAAEKYLFKFLGSKEYINGTQRWILFLRDCPPNELKKMPLVIERVTKVREFRLSSKAKEIHKFAETPTLFAQQTQPIGKDFIIVPIVSSSRRRYIPMGYVKGDVLVNNRVFVIPDATLYEFGVLMSNVHNSWMRRVAVRLKDDYSYSKDLVYNTFVWPDADETQMERISATGREILRVRERYQKATLADLYDPDAMPPDLLKAHQANDRAVMQAYGMPIKETDEASCVAWLMRLYQQKVTEQK